MSAQISPKFQSFNWLRGVAADKRISVVLRFVLMRLCLYRRNDSGICEPGYETIKDEVGVGRATIFRAIDAGVKYGWIAPPIRRGPANNSFVFTFPEEVARQRPQEVSPERPQEAKEVSAKRKRGLTSE